MTEPAASSAKVFRRAALILLGAALGFVAGARLQRIWKSPPVPPKPAHGVRVIVIGGSAAKVYMNGNRLAEFLELALPPGTPVELIGHGQGGIDSEEEKRVLAANLRLGPDVLVLFSGNNESAPEGSTLERRHARFESNLREMVRMGRRAGAAVVVCTLPVNPDSPPKRDPPWDSGEYRKAFAAYDAGRWEPAAVLFGAFASARPDEPFGLYWRAMSSKARGDYRAARRDFLRLLELRSPGATPAINQTIRRVAAEEGAALADIEKAFLDSDPRWQPDGRYFVDGTHWYPEYNPLVSLTIIDALRRRQAESPIAALPKADLWDLSRLGPRRRAASRPRVPYPEHLERIVNVGIMLALTTRLSDGLSESALYQFQLALGIDPGALARLLVYDRAKAAFAANPWGNRLQSRLRAEWPRVLAHAKEAERRMSGAAGRHPSYRILQHGSR